MKFTKLAGSIAIAMGMTSTAYAESSVTLYGVVDVGVNY